MLEYPPELSPDLDWLLSGTQTSELLILKTLVSELLGSVYRLVYSILDEPSMAEQATIQTFVHVLIERYKYHGAEGVDLFVYSHAIRECKKSKEQARKAVRPSQRPCESKIEGYLKISYPEPSLEEMGLWLAVKELDSRLRIPLILECLHGFTPQEIGFLTKTNPERVKAQLLSAKNHLIQAVNFPNISTQPDESIIVDFIHHRWPPVECTEQCYEWVISEIQMRVSQLYRVNRLKTRFLKTTLVGLTAVTLIVIGWITNRIASPETPMPLTAYTVIVTQIVHVPVYITPTPLPEFMPGEALTITSSQEEIWQRIVDSHQQWRTLWADALIFHYGPAGYVGPPVVRREQLWVDESDNSLLLSGDVGGEVDIAQLSIKGQPIVKYTSDSYLSPADKMDLLQIFSSDEWFGDGLVLSIVEAVNVIGRDALVLDMTTQEGKSVWRLWIERESGIVLGSRRYDVDGITVLVDIYLADLVMNVELPDKVFNPLLPVLNFMKDYRAIEIDISPQVEVSIISQMGHEPYHRVKPPASFDPSQSYLVFQWRQFPYEQSNNMDIVPVDVFAGGYYLGEIRLGNPWLSICERSPDGNHLAIVEQPDQPPFPATRMRLLKLSDLGTIFEPLTTGSWYGNDFAFSPDNQRLAFWGCGGREDNCGVYILDLNTHKLLKLLPGRYAGYFVWSPDSKELAMLRSDEKFIIVNSTTGQITYEQSMDGFNPEMPEDSPLNKWGVTFPPDRNGLYGCELPGRY